MNQLTHELKVVTVTEDPEAYPKYAEASAEYPELVGYLEDEFETFIVDSETGEFWPEHDFFGMSEVTAIAVDPEELAKGIRGPTCR